MISRSSCSPIASTELKPYNALAAWFQKQIAPPASVMMTDSTTQSSARTRNGSGRLLRTSSVLVIWRPIRELDAIGIREQATPRR